MLTANATQEFFLWIQTEAPGPQGSAEPGMLCLQEAVQGQHSDPLWQKTCGLSSKERGRWAETVGRVRTLVGGAVNTGKHEREKKSRGPGSGWIRNSLLCRRHYGIPEAQNENKECMLGLLPRFCFEKHLNWLAVRENRRVEDIFLLPSPAFIIQF